MISYLERFILEFKLKSVTKKGLEMEEKKTEALNFWVN